MFPVRGFSDTVHDGRQEKNKKKNHPLSFEPTKKKASIDWMSIASA
jgi:hypothetical protein